LGLIYIDADQIIKTELLGTSRGNKDVLTLSDNVIISLVMNHLKSPAVALKGYVLSGFPRIRAQALSLISAGHIPSHIGISFLIQLLSAPPAIQQKTMIKT
jgi:hypothetical protein